MVFFELLVHSHTLRLFVKPRLRISNPDNLKLRRIEGFAQKPTNIFISPHHARLWISMTEFLPVEEHRCIQHGSLTKVPCRGGGMDYIVGQDDGLEQVALVHLRLNQTYSLGNSKQNLHLDLLDAHEKLSTKIQGGPGRRRYLIRLTAGTEMVIVEEETGKKRSLTWTGNTFESREFKIVWDKPLDTSQPQQ